MPAGFVNQTVYVGPGTTISQSLWDTVGDGTGNKIPGTLVRSTAGNVAGVGAGGDLHATGGGAATAAVPTGAGNTVVKASAGRLCRVLVTTAGTGAGSVLIYDNASTNSGTVIGVIPATVAVGTYYTFDLPAANGITAENVASGPVLTVSYF